MLKEETSRPAILGNWPPSIPTNSGTGSIRLFFNAADGLSRYCWGDEQDMIAVTAFGVERIRCRMCSGTVVDQVLVSLRRSKQGNVQLRRAA